MELYEIKQLLKTKSIYDIPMRVTFYARVSTESEEQLNSLGNQVQYYEEYIKANKNWTYVKGYIDEGITGTSIRKRENFNLMINDAMSDKFDYIISKELSRFARKTSDSLKYIEKLSSKGVGVFFQGNNLNTLDVTNEVFLTIMAAMAQDESRKISERVKFGHSQAIKNGVVEGNSRIFGYIKDSGKLIIDEKQAEMIRLVYELYSTGEYSLKQIEDTLYDKGYRNLNGNKIMHNTLSNIISNPKYKGYYCGNKVKVVDMFTKKQKYMSSDDWVMWKDETGQVVPAIVSEEIWDKANNILKQRSNIVKSHRTSFKRNNLFTGKIICAEHNVSYHLKQTKCANGIVNPTWVCSHKIKYGAKTCNSFYLYESDLKEILRQVILSISGNIDDVCKNAINMYSKILSKNTNNISIDKLKQDLEKIEIKKDKILEYNLDGKITDDEFIKRNNKFNDEMLEIQEQLNELSKAKNEINSIADKINSMKKIIKNIQADTKNFEISKEVIDILVDKIIVYNEDKNVAKLEIRLNTGAVTESKITNTRLRSGNIIKNILPERNIKIIKKEMTAIGHTQTYTLKYNISI